jgi:hypothetical protein
MESCWMRIAADLQTTVRLRLEVRLSRGEDDWWDCEYALDGVTAGGFGRQYPRGEEPFLAELAGDLREHGLDEAVWGGWPMCPVHPNHPLDPVVDSTDIAVWRCPRGQVIARIGDLRP